MINKSSWTLAVVFGVISGTLGTLITICFISNGMGKFAGHPFDYTPNVTCMFAGLVVMALAIKIRRDKGLGGYITMGQCAELGLKIGLFAGIISGFAMYYYFTSVNPAAITKTVNTAKTLLGDINQVTNEKESDKAVAKFDQLVNSGTLNLAKFIGIQIFVYSIIYNLIFAAIGGAFLRKDPPELS
jgi:Protein of unknown function (DUF4199)/Translation-initiation factor 2